MRRPCLPGTGEYHPAAEKKGTNETDGAVSLPYRDVSMGIFEGILRFLLSLVAAKIPYVLILLFLSYNSIYCGFRTGGLRDDRLSEEHIGQYDDSSGERTFNWRDDLDRESFLVGPDESERIRKMVSYSRQEDYYDDDLIELPRKKKAERFERKSRRNRKSESERKVKTKHSTQRTAVYRVKRGDTLFGISRKFSIDVNELSSLNRIGREKKLYAGMKIKIPANKPETSEEKRKAKSEKTESGDLPRFKWPVRKIVDIKKSEVAGVKSLGIIIIGRPGELVVSSARGVVKKVGRMRGFGRYVVMAHDNRYLTVYANLDDIDVQKGDRLNAGRTIGRIPGNECRLHFQIHHAGKARDPLLLLPKRKT